MRTMKTLAIAAFAASALALAGCGGGGSSSTATPPTQTSPTPAELAATATTALDTAKAAVDAVMDDSDAAAVTAADTAVAAAETAVMAASESDDHAALSQRLGTLQGSLAAKKQSRLAAMGAEDTQDAKDRTALAKALKKAIDGTAIGADGNAITVTPTSIPAIDTSIPADSTADTAALTLKKGASVGSLGSWSGTDYAGEDGSGNTKSTGMVRAYSNEEAAKSHSFTSEAGEALHSLQHADTTVRGDYALSGTDATTDPPVSSEIGGFPTTGQESYDEDDTVTGTYMGAAGTYKCIAATGCTSNAAGADGIDLSGGWTFTPSATAMVLQKDASYLQFGWWVRKDKDGPTHAGVFYRNAGATALTADDGTITNTITGKATYVGSAAGKFAVSDPLRPAHDNAGHFTADAELMAEFKGTTGADLSGIIDKFRLNDGSDDPGWSIALQKPSAPVTNGEFGRAANAGTVWSIGGAKTAASGAWEARMYDDKPAASSPNNTPDSVVGSFSSSIGSTHSLVGAFGAERQQ